MEKRWVRVTLKVLKYTGISIFSLFLLLVFLVWLFEDKIKQYAVQHLNQYLNTEVKVGSIDLTVFSSFPYASLEFKDVLIMDPVTVNKQKDTMLFTEKLSLDFSIWDILADDYTISDIDIKNGDFRLYVDESGNENYIFWKSDTVKSDKEEKFHFDLQRIHAENSKLRYINRVNHQDFSFKIRQVDLAGNFTEKKFTLKGRLNAFVYHLRDKSVALVKNKSTTAEFELLIDNEKNKYTFQNTSLLLEKMPFTISGSITDEKKLTSCDLQIDGKNIDIEDVLNTYPSLLGEDVKNYESEGTLKFNATVKGNISKTEKPSVEAFFSVANGKLTERKNGISLTKIYLNGNYTNRNKYEEEELSLTDVSAQFKDGKLKGNIFVTGFENPKIKSHIEGDFNLETLHGFFHFENIKQLAGRLSVNGNLNGTWLATAENDSTDFIIKKAEGSIHLGEVSLKLYEQNIQYSQINGEVVVKDNNATVDGLSATINTTAFRLNGILKNFVPYVLFTHQKMNIVAELYSENININDIIGKETMQEKQGGPPFALRFPDDINFNFDASIGKLTFDTFTAENVSGNFKLIDRLFTASGLTMNTAGGTLGSRVEVDGRSGREFFITSTTEVNEVNITSLFTSFGNFGQDEITDKHLKGKINASISFGAVMDTLMNILPDKVVSVADIKITDGELINLQSLTDIAAWMRTNAKMKLAMNGDIDDLEKRLTHVKFSELKNTIHIKGEKIEIPAMEVNTSAMKIKLSGTHSFKNEIEYHFSFRFLELRQQNPETEYGFIADDGTGMMVFIRMFGTVDEPKFEEDETERKNFRKEYNEKEVQNLKAIFKEEFGLFKKDSTLKIKETPKEDVKFLLEWDEEKKKEPEVKEPEKKNNNSRFNKFKNKYGSEKPKEIITIDK